MTTSTENPSSLRDIYLFADLTEEQLGAVVDRSTEIRVPAGNWLFSQGEEARSFFLVEEGQIALFRQSVEGEEKIFTVLESRDTFAEGTLFRRHATHSLHARALRDSRLLAFDRSHFRGYLGESVELCFKLMSTLHRREQLLLDEVEQLTLQNATQRLVGHLLQQIGDRSGPQRVELSIPKHILAARLSIKPETLSRILGRLRECSYIREDGDSIVLPDPDNLRMALRCFLCGGRSWGCPGPEPDDRAAATALAASLS